MERVMIGFYSGTIMYTNLYEDKNLEGRYGEDVMSVGLKEIKTFAMLISYDVGDSNGKRRWAWIGWHWSLHSAILMVFGNSEEAGSLKHEERQMGACRP